MKKRKLSRKEIRYTLIKELKKAEKQLLFEKEKNKLIDQILHENKNVINSKYLTNKEINENILASIADMASPLISNLIPGFIGQFKQRLVTDMFDSLDVNVESRFAKAVINILEEIKYTKLLGYFRNWSSGGCEDFIDDITRGLSDSFQEAMLEYLGMDIQSQGALAGSSREAVTATINDQLIPAIKPYISDFICNLPVGDMLKNMKGLATGEKSFSDIFSGSERKVSKLKSKKPTRTDDSPLGKLASRLG